VYRFGLLAVLLMNGGATAPVILAQQNFTDDKIALCDIFSRIGLKIYSEKILGMSYDAALNAVPMQSMTLDQALADQPEKLKTIHNVIHIILQKAYTSSWPSPEAFAEEQRSICLNGH
jgi:hypothetical protein